MVYVSASDNVGVTRVALFVGGSEVVSSTTAPYTIAWNTGAHPDGYHTIQVRAYDAAGNVGSSESQRVLVFRYRMYVTSIELNQWPDWQSDGSAWDSGALWPEDRAPDLRFVLRAGLDSYTTNTINNARWINGPYTWDFGSGIEMSMHNMRLELYDVDDGGQQFMASHTVWHLASDMFSRPASKLFVSSSTNLVGVINLSWRL